MSLFDTDISWGSDETSKKVKKIDNADLFSKETPVMIKRTSKAIYRKAYSELKLIDLMDGDLLENGNTYNFISAGDIDGLSYLKLVLRQQKVDHLILSTWCMATDDILQIREWILEGLIKKVDFYVGEIFKGTYYKEYELLKQLIKETECGRVVIFRNHSKILAGTGEKFDFGIQMSCNINTNPRTENACIQVGTDIYNFYKQYFDGILSFE